MEFKTDALLLRSADTGENDRMVTLLTADRGKIGAAMRGVKKAGAKLKFAAQPFCFAEYVIVEKNGRHTVISAALHDDFFSLREDIKAFYAGSCVLETCDKLILEGMESREMLLTAVAALTAIGENASRGLIEFLLKALFGAGYPIRADDCPFCGKELSEGRLRFDLASGSFACEACAKGVPASRTTYSVLRAALQRDSALPEKEREDGEKRALRLLSSYFTYQTDAQLYSLFEFIKLL